MQEKHLFGFCSAVSVWQAVSETDITKRSPTHSYTLATGGGSISSMKRSRVIIYYFCSFDTFFISLTDAPFGVTLPSKHNKKANQVSLIVHNTHTQTHTCQHQWLVRNFVCCFLFPFFSYQRDLTLWPWFQPSRWQHRRQAYIILVLVPVWRACPW